MTAARVPFRRFVISLFVCLLVARAGQCRELSDDLLVKTWTPGQDPRQQTVLALLKAHSGYLWVGTGRGLVRFDGVNFTRFTAENTPGIAGDRISFGTLWEDKQGALWAGTDFNGVLRTIDGRFQTISMVQGLPSNKVLRIDGDASGAVWVFTPAGVARWQDGHVELPHPEREGLGARNAIEFSYQRTIDFAKAGLWRHTKTGLERFAYGKWETFPLPDLQGRAFEDDVREIYEDSLHRVWYAVHSRPQQYFCVAAGKLTTFDGLPKDALVSYQDSLGFLWLSDHQGHSARWRNGKLYPVPGLQAPFLLNAVETHGGEVWAGTAGTPLYQFRARRIPILPTPGVPEIGPVLYQQHDGTVWAGGTGLARTAGNPAEGLDVLKAHQAPRDWLQIKAISEDNKGNLLVAARGAPSILRLEHDRFHPGRAVPGTVQAMLRTSSGEQWIGSTVGLYRLQAAGAIPESVVRADVRCLVEGSPGVIWAGTSEGPRSFANGREVPALAEGQSWRYGSVAALKIDARGRIVIATADHGFVLVAGGKARAFGMAEGLPTNNIYNLELGADGDLWLGSDVGLLRVRSGSIEKSLRDPATRLHFTLFDEADGLPASILDPLGNESTLRRADGHVWLSTERGIAEIDPEALSRRASAAHAVLEEHSIDQSGLLPGTAVVLGPRQMNLELHYTALGSERPEQVSFRYRLEGYDAKWIYAHDRRVAFYSHLPAGHYKFTVQAANDDGEGWESPGATMTLQVLAPYYKTWWWNLAVACACLVLVIVSVYRRQSEQVRKQKERQAFTHRLILTQETERKRVAHELHDSLGQHLAVIRTLATVPSVQEQDKDNSLLEIADQAAVALHEVQSIAYGLRPYQLDRLGLTRALLSLIKAFETSSRIETKASVDDVDEFFTKGLEIHFYRIVQEALSNILQHAEARHATVEIRCDGPELSLLVEDDGKGFAQQRPPESSLGVIGMHERADALGGTATLTSSPGMGTRLFVKAIRRAATATDSETMSMVRTKAEPLSD